MSKIVEDSLQRLLKTPSFKVLEENATSWAKMFGARQVQTPTTIAIPVFPETKRNARLKILANMIQQLIDNRRVKSVKANIVDQVEQEKNAGLILDHLHNLSNLYGITIVSSPQGIGMIYRGVVTAGLQSLEQIRIVDDDIVTAVQELDFGRVSRDYIMPLNGSFDANFFRNLKDIVEGKYDEVRDKSK